MRWALAVLALAAPCWGCDAQTCATDAEGLHELLSAASAGSVVCLDDVRVEGSFTVPPGVTLQGQGPGSVIVTSGDNAAIAIVNDGSETGVRDLAIESTGLAAVVARGTAPVFVTDVSATLTRGIGVAVEHASRVELTNVTVEGPVTPGNADAFSVETSFTDTATHGVVLLEVLDARLEHVTAEGFALFGVLTVDSIVEWRGGQTDSNLAVGFMVAGGRATIRDVQSCGTLQGVRLNPAYAAVTAYGASVDVEGLTVCDGDGVGVLHSDASGTYRGIVGAGNNNAAMWIQRSTGVEVGPGTNISGNYFAGIVVVDSRDVAISGGRIEQTATALRLSGTVGQVRVGDGIRVGADCTDVRIENVALVDNETAGCTVECSSLSEVTFEGVVAEASGLSLGVVACCDPLSADWDLGVERRGATLDNDANYLLRCAPDDVGMMEPPPSMFTHTF